MHRSLLAFSLLFLALSSPASAEFGDCMDPGYLGRFIEAGSAGSLTCVEDFRFSYDTPEGPREIRAISDAAADWAIPPALVASIERGAREAVAATGGLGDFAVDDVTFLILDDRTDWGSTADSEVQAVTDGSRDVAGNRPGECLVTLFGLASGASPEEMAVTVAHEYFHCLQYATFSEGQMGSYSDGGAWWIEGAAEYFSAVAVSGSIPFTGRAAEFDAAVASEVPLHDMAHESAPFFFWLGETYDLAKLMEFQHAMAAGGGTSSQRAAMRGALSGGEWLDFAKAYADSAIGHPQGGSLGLVPDFPPRLQVEGPGTAELSLVPFALYLGTISYSCSVWGNRLTPADANLVLRQNEGAWAPWPAATDARETGSLEYQAVGLHTGDDDLGLSVRVERRESCRPCRGLAEVDSCLVGTWEVTGGGPEAWMEAQGLPMRAEVRGPRIVTFQSDGGYATEPFGVGAEYSDDDVVMRGEGWVTTAFGNWSAGAGTLNICQLAGGLSGDVTIETPTRSGSMPVSRPGAGEISMSYSCNEGTLSTSMQFPGLPDMETSYGRIAGEAP